MMLLREIKTQNEAHSLGLLPDFLGGLWGVLCSLLHHPFFFYYYFLLSSDMEKKLEKKVICL